jgi:hypothetical protein
MNSLTARERKLVAIGILVALIALVWVMLISPIASGFAQRAAERERLSARFASNERLIASIPRLRNAIENRAADFKNFRTEGESFAAVIEALKERLGSQIAANGGELRAMQEVSDRPGWVRAWVEARMTLPQMIATLEKVQNQPPYLAVNSLTISADRALQSGKLDLMDIRIEASSPASAPKPR